MVMHLPYQARCLSTGVTSIISVQHPGRLNGLPMYERYSLRALNFTQIVAIV